MKKKLLLGLLISSLFGVFLFNNSASALSMADVIETCTAWRTTLNPSSLTCFRPHESGLPECYESGGSSINGGSSGITCQWQRSDLVPTVRTDAGKVCTTIWGGVWDATSASCVADSDKFSNYGSCSDWGGTVTNTGSHGEMTCKWVTLAPGYDPTASVNPDALTGDGTDDDDDDDDEGDGKVPFEDVDEGLCTSILPDSWCKDDDAIGNVISLVITLLSGAVVVAGVIGIVICGVMWMSARDNEQQVVKAKKRILEIVIGIAAWVLLAVLVNLIIPKDVDSINNNIGGEIDVYIPTPTPSTPGTPTTPTDPSTPSTPTTWNRLCGPDPDETLKVSKYGSYTSIYKNKFGRTFYTYKQGDPLWGSLPGGVNSSGVLGTLSSRGCYRTSIAEMFNSFGMVDFTPANLSTNDANGMDIDRAQTLYPDAANYLTFAHHYSSSTWKSKIIETMKAGGGVILLLEKASGVENDFTTSMHKMPIVDYDESTGKVYVANTVRAEEKNGWFDLDYLLTSNKVNVQEVVTILPKDSSLKCN